MGYHMPFKDLVEGLALQLRLCSGFLSGSVGAMMVRKVSLDLANAAMDYLNGDEK